MNWIKNVKKVYDGCTGCEYYRITYGNGVKNEISTVGKSKSLIVLMEELVLSTSSQNS